MEGGVNYLEAVRAHGGIKPAARALGIPYTSFHRSLKKAEAIATPPAPEVHLPIEKILAQQSERFGLMRSIDDAQQWPVIRIKEKLPIGVLWFGDPHLGDNGCNIDLLRSHVELCKRTDGLYGANIGDTTNNWLTAGKLGRLWAEQETSISTERRLAQWFMTESGVNWLVWLIGNHDAWNSGEAILRGMNTAAVFMQNWEAKFKLEWPSGEQLKIHAAHNFKGFSDWNPMHGPLKASIKSSDADLYIAGHIHTPGSMQLDIAHSARFPLLLRVASYKRFDLHAKLHGFADHSQGSAVLTIFNPDALEPSGKITHFFDLELGARVLTMLRKGHKHATAKDADSNAGARRPRTLSGGPRRSSKRRSRDANSEKLGVRKQRASAGSGFQQGGRARANPGANRRQNKPASKRQSKR